MVESFLKGLFIRQVRHLKNITISISETEKKHLIISGKNGSGKTSLLKSITKNFNAILGSIGMSHNYSMWTKITEIQKNQFDPLIDKTISYLNGIILHINQEEHLKQNYRNGNFIVAYFDSKRLSEVKTPTGIQKIDFQTPRKIENTYNQNFLQYIVNLKAEKSFAKDDSDSKRAKELDEWFYNFEKNLKKLFDDPDLNLIFDRKEYNFYLLLNNGNKVTFNQLSDGYSAIINIITELIMRMEKKSSGKYDMQGIVLIDEIETHLHVDLQKMVMPFLTDFFPNLQFIVTTHSPFVISSIKDAVVYDLEKNIRIEDASGYSYDTLIESYFDSDKYSEVIKSKVSEYEKLSGQKNLSNDENEKLVDLKSYFKNLPMLFSPELEVKLQQIKLQNLNNSNG